MDGDGMSEPTLPSSIAARLAGDSTVTMTTTNLDEYTAHWFKQGWDAALREATLQYDSDRLLAFLREQGIIIEGETE